MSTQKEKPVIFNSEMVRAVLDGRKTQTRSIVKPQPSEGGLNWVETPEGFAAWQDSLLRLDEYSEDGGPCQRRCPYGQVGDRLYVREAFWDKGYWKTDKNSKNYWTRWPPKEEKIDFYYSADGKPDRIRGSYNPMFCLYLRQHPSVHMLKKDARIWLEVTAIRCERVRSISEQDTKGEGVIIRNIGETHYRAFKELWDSINEKRGFGWDKNPWVWVVEFKRITK